MLTVADFVATLVVEATIHQGSGRVALTDEDRVALGEPARAFPLLG